MLTPIRYSRALLAAIAALGLSSLSIAQSVATSPVGATAYTLKQGSQLVGVSMLKPSLAAGAVSAVNALTLTGSASTNYGAVLTAGAPYYLEITEDNVNASLYVGDRFDVDTAATISAAAGTIVLKTTLENTVVGNPPAALVGTKFVIRQHFTLGGLLADMPGAFLAGDKITIRKDGGGSITATLNGTGVTWAAGITNSNSVIVYPGVGFFLVRASVTQTTGTIVGSVRTNTFVQVLRQGNQVIAEGFPVDSAPAPASGGPSRQFTNTAGATFASGDKLTAYNPTGQLVSYTYSTTNNRWSAGITNGTALNLFHPTSASFLTLATANTNYVQLVPFSL